MLVDHLFRRWYDCTRSLFSYSILNAFGFVCSSFSLSWRFPVVAILCSFTFLLFSLSSLSLLSSLFFFLIFYLLLSSILSSLLFSFLTILIICPTL